MNRRRLQALCETTARNMAGVVIELRNGGQDDEADEATRLHDGFVAWAQRALSAPHRAPFEPLATGVIDLAAERRRRRGGTE